MHVTLVTRVRRGLLVLGALAALWAAVVALTGGFVISFDQIRVSSRNPRNVVLIALLSGLAAWALALPDWRRGMREDVLWALRAGSVAIQSFKRLWQWLQPAGPAAMIALGAVVLEIHEWTGGRTLWLDEEMIAINVRDRSFVDLAGPLWLGQTAPFGWLAAQRAAVLALGTSEQALRVVPLLFGIATVAASVWVGRRWMRPLAAAVLVLLCAVGQFLSYYRFEVKHYSADAFWGLLLPISAAWALEAEKPAGRTRRAEAWWGAAAIGHWFANGALLVTPACALVLMVALWRRQGGRAALRFLLFGTVWLASVGLHYLVALRHAMKSAYLASYWSFAWPPASAGLREMAGWFAGRLQPLADNPGGASLWILFWISVTLGFALGRSSMLRIVLAAVPLSAFVFTAFRVVPLFERLSLWVVPALYVGIALFADSGVRLAHDAYARRSWARLALAVAVAFVSIQLCSNILWRGREDIRVGRPLYSKHGLDDRTAVRWLMRERQPGDVLMTTRLALPAIWWYGGIPLSNQIAGSRHPDGASILTVRYMGPESNCRRDSLRDALSGYRRVLVYFGFKDVPEGFDDLLLQSLDDLGVIKASYKLADAGRISVIDLRSTSAAEEAIRPRPAVRPVTAAALKGGCFVAEPAERW